MRQRILIACFFSGLLWILPAAAAPDEIIEEANQAYTKGEYSYAIELYQQVLDQGMVAPELYYNLGNAFFRENQMGQAILHYERALRLRPGDENMQHNLDVANRQIVDLIEPVPLIFYERWWQGFLKLQSVDTWAWIGFGSLIFFFGMLSVYLFSQNSGIKKIAFAGGILLLVFTSLAFIAAHKQYQYFHNQQQAIVMVPRITAKSGPGETSPDLFLIHEGSKVSLNRELGDWFEVRLANGNVGWIKKTALEVI